jgi:Sodium/hydrogen exchanger family
MPHQTSLIATLVAGIGLAFILGALANRLRLQPVVGYLMAGVLIGPFTPGFVADQGLADQLAEVGVILLLFGVGLHFSVGDLNAVKGTAIPGATGQIIIVALLGFGLAQILGWPLGGPRSVSRSRRSCRPRRTTTVLATDKAKPKTTTAGRHPRVRAYVRRAACVYGDRRRARIRLARREAPFG